MTLGSLFDGIGGFPFAAVQLGIEPIWASEIEPAPISITKRHFPKMKHLGNITKINGAEIEPVDIITFGSPCQDLSLAGNRKGLAGARSGLFMEAVRIIKEMRNKTHGKYPAFAVWENVNGAFSSNGGEDFRVVLEAIANIAEQGISIPRFAPRRKWFPAGAVLVKNGSLAWRVLDAQYWGVPQRRKRIFLVADFRGQRAGEILFKPESLPGNTAESGKAGEGTAGDTENDLVAFSMQRIGEYKESHVSKTIAHRDYKSATDLIIADYKVRRLTPTECERLMGFTGGWTEYGHDGKKISDSARYRALGNSVAIPCVVRVLQGIMGE